MADNSKRNGLDTPTIGAKKTARLNLDGDGVGRTAEGIARFLGTGQYLAYQTIVVVVWVLLNIGGVWWNWDPYPFILLNLAFSTQAAYAAPLILLAQNRQDARDRISLDEDRRRAAETKADTEYLARELAGLRIAINETVTRDYLRRELEDIRSILQQLDDKLDDHRSDSLLEQQEQQDHHEPSNLSITSLSTSED